MITIPPGAVFSYDLPVSILYILICCPGDDRMFSDLDVRSCSRRCVTSQRVIEPGEVYYSVLQLQGAEIVRLDYRADAWLEPPENSFGWWRSRLPAKSGIKASLAPRDVLVNLLVQLADVPEETEFRYVLALVLMRRRIIRMESTETDDLGHQRLVLHCPYRSMTLEVQVANPSQEQSEQLQQRLFDLLYSNGEEAGIGEQSGNGEQKDA